MNINISYDGKSYYQQEESELLEAGVPQSIIDEKKVELESASTVASRIIAYKAESDPLYMEWKFDQTPESEQAWRDKVAEIKARYPLAETE